MPDQNHIENECTEVCTALARVGPNGPTPEMIATALSLARGALNAARGELCALVLERLVARVPSHAEAWQLLGFAYGEIQHLPKAAAALDKASRLCPEDPKTAFARAQACLDAGFASVQLFEAALKLAPDNLGVINGWAAALAEQGDRAAAESVLVSALLRHPDWLAGHSRLAALRFASGDSRHFARSYAAACATLPHNLPLRLAWFGAFAQTHDWKAALEIVADGERIFDSVAAFTAARAYVASESGAHSLADRLFAQLPTGRDAVLAVAHLRHCLRTLQLEQAEQIALSFISGPAAAMVWPYLSLIWRMRGDGQAAWLDGTPAHVRSFDLDYTPGELEELGAVLRRIRTAPTPYLDQSVRGGRQTSADRQLFFRAEPEVRKLREKVLEAVGDYIANLPPHVQHHPLLGVARDRIRFSGSWSVRLQAHGFHISHTHPRGWISSALYISVPAQQQLGLPPAGWIRFGCAPQGLGLDLPAYTQVEPKPGRLILFPSTMWHETLPFADGERLAVAFDVMKPTVVKL